MCPASAVLQRAAQRAQAAACLPRIPGPIAAHADGCGSNGGSMMSASSQPQHDKRVGVSCGNDSGSKSKAQRSLWQCHRQEPEPPQEEALPSSWECSQREQPHLSDLPPITRTGDILVVAVGYPNLVTRAWVKPGAVVIDVGINVVNCGDSAPDPATTQEDSRRRTEGAPRPGMAAPDAQLTADSEAHDCPAARYEEEPAQSTQSWHVVGDVDFDDVAAVASALAPVPGGVGPMTIAAVLHNTVQAARLNLGLDQPCET